MNNYRKIVIADNSEVEQKYKSDIRGRVQDRNVNIKITDVCSYLLREDERCEADGTLL